MIKDGLDPTVYIAHDFALKVHGDQRYGRQPYIVHPLAVLGIALKFKIEDNSTLVACLLHDTLEDTPTTKDDLEVLFGLIVADIVWRVTDEPGKNRRERQERTFKKIQESDRARKVKLCDRIANMEQAIADYREDPRAKGSLLLGMYRKEMFRFVSLIRPQSPREEDSIERGLWAHLEHLAQLPIG